MILVDIGEIGIHTEGGVVYKLRPSFYAMSKLGTPAEIVTIFAELHSDYVSSVLQDEQFSTALAVLYACAPDDMPALFGSIEYSEEKPEFGQRPKTLYVQGAANKDDVLPLARSLILHGVVGKVPKLEREDKDDDAEEDFVAEFHAREFVAVAIAHLGMSEHEAWTCTMTSFALAMRAKFPPIKKDDKSPGRGNAPTAKEVAEIDAWADSLGM